MELVDRSILVTGGAGFIGSHLVEALLHEKAMVSIVDNLNSGSWRNLRRVDGEVIFHQMDIGSTSYENLIVRNHYDVIFHLAANAYIPPAVANPEYDFRVNLLAPFRMFDVLRRHDIRPVIVAMSSAAVYGNPYRIPVSEDDPTVPVSPYGVSKLGMERYLAVFCQLYGFRAAALRLFSVYGPRQHKQIVYDFIRKLSENPHQMELIGDGSQVRDLVYVDDVVQAALLVARSAPLEGEVYNVGCGEGHSTIDIANIVCQVMNVSPTYQFTGHVRPGDTEKWIASIERLQTLGFEPRVTLEQGIAQTYAWYQQPVQPIVREHA